MRLVDLNPRFIGAGGPGHLDGETGEEIPERTGVGMSFDCPCGCGARPGVMFENPVDGGEAWERAEVATNRRVVRNDDAAPVDPARRRLSMARLAARWRPGAGMSTDAAFWLLVGLFMLTVAVSPPESVLRP